MKYIIFVILFVILNFSLEAQIREVKITDNWDDYFEIHFFLNGSYEVVDSLDAKYCCIEKRKIGNPIQGVQFVYQLDRKLFSVKRYSNLEENKLDGLVQYYYENGLIESIKTYENDKLNGAFVNYYEDGGLRFKGSYKNDSLNENLKTYYEDGNMRRDDYYSEGNLIKANCYTNSRADTTYFPFSEQAGFEGGAAALEKWISENLIYPEVALDMGEQGKVYISFVVEEDGSISNVEIAKGVSLELDKESKRVVRAMPKWTPGKLDGYLQRTRCYLPIIFSLR